VDDADLEALDAYFDAAPRSSARAVETGAFTLFVSRTAWSYYARPARTHPDPITPADLVHLEQACTEHRVVPAIEWIDELHPELTPAAAGFGLTVQSHALMVASGAPGPATRDLPGGLTVGLVGADDPELLQGRAVADLAFGAETQTRTTGPAERMAAAARLSADLVEHLRTRHRLGLTVTALAHSDQDGVLAIGSYQPVGEIAEIVGVATLPSARRQGLAGAVTTFLVAHARAQGIRTVLLSAQNADVARLYERVGFRRIGSTGAAERPTAPQLQPHPDPQHIRI